MATSSRDVHGVPNRVDLSTTDVAPARAFYGALFGWEFSDEPADDSGGVYVMATLRGHTVAGMMAMSEELAASGMPPMWNSYVAVDDLEAAVARVTAANGSVLDEPEAAGNAGRFALVADPAGAVFCLWEATGHAGAEMVNEAGAVCWNELTTPDPAIVAPFYAEVLGWTADVTPMPGGGDYTVFHVEGGSPDGIAGAMVTPQAGIPTAWTVYFAVDDVASTVDQARALGAQIFLEPMFIEGVGTMATIGDPRGAVFAVMTMTPDD